MMLIKLTRVIKGEKQPCLVNTEQIAFIRPSNSKGSTIIFATEEDWELDVVEDIEQINYLYLEY